MVGFGTLDKVPAKGEDLIRGHLAAWERFLHEERQLDPLIRIGCHHRRLMS